MDLISGYQSVFVFDPKPEYFNKYPQLTDLPSLVSYAKKGASCAFYNPTKEAFKFFCDVAHGYAKICSLKKIKACIVLEEIASFTQSGKASEELGNLIRMVLCTGCDVVIVTQRLAEADSTGIGNASIIHMTKAVLPRDRQRFSDVSGVPIAVIDAMRADGDSKIYDYVRADLDRGFWQSGVLSIRNNKAFFNTNSQKNNI